MDAPWRSLSIFTSSDHVRSWLGEMHEREPNGAHVRQVVSYFSQARDYFSSSETASLTIRPLLTYYGVLTLARGTLLLARGQSEAILSQSHGLVQRNWQDAFADGRIDPGPLTISLTKGTFKDLCDLAMGRTVSWVYTGPFPKRTTLELNIPAPPVGTEFTLEELLERTPELQPPFRAPEFDTEFVYGCVPFLTVDRARGNVILDVYIAIDGTVSKMSDEPSDALDSFGEVVFDTVGIGGENDVRLVANSHFFPDRTVFAKRLEGSIGDVAKHLNYIEHSHDGRTFATAPYPNGARLSPMPRLFAISYALGMLTRYYPVQWSELVRGAKGDRLMPHIHEAIDLIENDFPQETLSLIEKIMTGQPILTV